MSIWVYCWQVMCRVNSYVWKCRRGLRYFRKGSSYSYLRDKRKKRQENVSGTVARKQVSVGIYRHCCSPLLEILEEQNIHLASVKCFYCDSIPLFPSLGSTLLFCCELLRIPISNLINAHTFLPRAHTFLA